MDDRQRIRRIPDAVGAGNENDGEFPDDKTLDRDYLTRVFGESGRYLPPPKRGRTTEPAARKREKPLIRGAKIAGLMLAVAVLTGSVVTASILAEQRHSRAARNPQTPSEITGAAALGGFVSPGPSRGGDSPPNSSESPESNSSTADLPTQGESSPQNQKPTTSAPRSSPSPSLPTTSQQASSTQSAPSTSPSNNSNDEAKLAAVSGFYARMDKDPQQALTLLDPVLTGTHATDLLQSWGTIKSLDVQDLRMQPDGSVRAVVVIDELSGGRVRITQLLKLTEGSTVKILDAWLLSAERL